METKDTIMTFRSSLVLILLLCVLHTTAQHIIPEPAEFRTTGGQFTLVAGTSIYYSHEDIAGIAKTLQTKFTAATGSQPKLNSTDKNAAIQLIILNKQDAKLGNEGYTLSIKPQGVTITANKKAGIFYGIQTLLQCFPASIEGSSKSTMPLTASTLEVRDYPRFAWRGIMLDVSRHFFDKEYVKRYIDQLARYKFNRLHLHLTDDQGWRIEIKSLPLLTSEGAWRVPRTGTFGSNDPPKPGEKATYGGYYTQEDIKELVQYAKERFVEIMPEIDVPGHSMAAIAAYPYLCVTQDTTIKVSPGSDFSDWFADGKFVMHIDNTLNPADERVYQFLDKVVTEVAALFPFEYIHMGGDECYYGFWEKDKGVQAFMKKNNLKDGHALQGYFTSRVNKIVRSKKKKMFGWDEILEGNPPSDAAVMSWQGVKGGIAASQQKLPVVMSPSPHYYLDMIQGEPSIEAPVYNSARLKEVYHFNILPKEADSTYILGGQGNIWTEQIPTIAQLEYMTYPRALAISETLWSPSARKNWDSFVIKTENHFSRLDSMKVNYAVSMYDPIIQVKKNAAGQLVIELATEMNGLDLHYTLDNSIPNQYHTKYAGPIELTPDVDYFKVTSYRNGKPAGRLIILKREDLAKRIRKK